MCDQTAMCEELGDDQELLALLKSEGDEGQAVLDHIESCSLCQQRLDSLAADQAELEIAVDVLTHRGGFDSELHSQSITESDWSETMAMKILSPASHPEMLGRIGRYDIERFIGSGGMGVVFKAYDSELNRPVAVKVLAPYLSGSGAARNRFAREARAAAAVVDDHVVPIHNVESKDEHPFLVMKYIAGASLQQRIDTEGPLDVREVLRIGMQTAKGLAVAHAQGLIHRDVKPSNILLDEGVERALLTDFGLARANDDANLTRSGFQPGTPHYMSPEQVRGEALDARSDLFGLGCVMYAMCTGHSPFRSETSYAVMRRITDDEPRPIQEINPDVPVWLSHLITKLLSKAREDRFASAEEVATVLEGCLAHIQQPTVVPLPIEVADSCNQRKTGWRIGSFMAAGAFSLLAIFAGVILMLEMGKGTLRIETSGASDVPIRISQGDKVYSRLTVSKEGATIRLKAGKYRIEIDDTATHLTMKGATVTLTKNDEPRHEITADEVTLQRGDDWLATVSVEAKTSRDSSNVPADTPLDPDDKVRGSAETLWPDIQGTWFVSSMMVLPEGDRKHLLGTNEDLRWSYSIGSRSMPPEISRLDVRGNEMQFSGSDVTYTFELDRSSRPYKVDLRQKLKTGNKSLVRAIIDLRDDELWLGQHVTSSGRPASFDAKGIFLLGFSRTDPASELTTPAAAELPQGWPGRRAGTGRPPRRTAAAETIEEYDRDNDGTLDKEEVPLGLKRGFEEIDTDGNRKIDEDELYLRYIQSSGMLPGKSSGLVDPMMPSGMEGSQSIPAEAYPGSDAEFAHLSINRADPFPGLLWARAQKEWANMKEEKENEKEPERSPTVHLVPQDGLHVQSKREQIDGQVRYRVNVTNSNSTLVEDVFLVANYAGAIFAESTPKATNSGSQGLEWELNDLKVGEEKEVVVAFEPFDNSHPSSITFSARRRISEARNNPEIVPVKIKIVDSDGKPVAGAEVELRSLTSDRVIDDSVVATDVSGNDGLATNRRLPFGHYSLSIQTKSHWRAFPRGINLEFDKGMNRTFVVPRGEQMAEVTLESSWEPSTEQLGSLPLGAIRNKIGMGWSVLTVPEPGVELGHHASHPRLGNGISELALGVKFYVDREVEQPDGSKLLWTWVPAAGLKSFLLTSRRLQRVESIEESSAKLTDDAKYFKDAADRPIGFYQIRCEEEAIPPVRLQLPAGRVFAYVTSIYGRPDVEARRSLRLPSDIRSDELWLEAQLKTDSAWSTHLLEGENWLPQRDIDDPQRIVFDPHILLQRNVLEPNSMLKIQFKNP